VVPEFLYNVVYTVGWIEKSLYAITSSIRSAVSIVHELVTHRNTSPYSIASRG